MSEGSVDLANDEDLLDLIVDSGFKRVFLGIETPDTESLQSANKRPSTLDGDDWIHSGI